MNKITSGLAVFFSTIFYLHGQVNTQCDSIKVYNGAFDKLIQNQYISIKADTVLAIRHCFTTNGCNNSFGLFCWKVNGQFYFKKMQSKKGKIKSNTRLSKELKQHLINFYGQQLFVKAKVINDNKGYGPDDGPMTILLFKTSNKCVRFVYGITSTKDTEIGLLWLNQLLTIMQK